MAPIRIVIDRDLCQGHGVCCSEAPEVFGMNDDQELQVLQEQPGEEQRAAIAQARKYCPTGAISVEDRSGPSI